MPARITTKYDWNTPIKKVENSLFKFSMTAGENDKNLVISSIIDNNMQSYNVTNDDCGDLTALVRAAGWDCRNSGGQLLMSCASPSPGGFQILNANVFMLQVRICPYGTSFGTAPLHIWYNAPTPPNPG